MLNERLTEAQNELIRLKLELSAERQKNEEAHKHAAAKAMMPAVSKPERTFLNAAIQALVCLIVFLVGFFIAMKFGPKSI